jgi:hypothetical protein
LKAQIISSNGSIFEIDVVTENSFDREFSVTSYPVERDVNKSDHVKKGSFKISVSGFFSGSSNSGRVSSKEKIDSLYEIQASSDFVTYVYNNELKENLIITSISSKMEGDSFTVEIKMEEVLIASFTEVDLPKSTKGKRTGKNNGRQDALNAGSFYDSATQNAAAQKAEKPEPEEERGSTLHNLFGS